VGDQSKQHHSRYLRLSDDVPNGVDVLNLDGLQSRVYFQTEGRARIMSSGSVTVRRCALAMALYSGLK
jgi:hypothetical protein